MARPGVKGCRVTSQARVHVLTSGCITQLSAFLLHYNLDAQHLVAMLTVQHTILVLQDSCMSKPNRAPASKSQMSVPLPSQQDLPAPSVRPCKW